MSSAIEKVDHAEITPMTLIQSAIMQGAGIDTIERLAKLQREMVEYQAKIEFNHAMQRVQSKMRRVSADANNPQTHSKYASYAQIDRALRPIYSAEGFSLSFNTSEAVPDSLRVLCNVSRGGYTEQYQVDMPADGKGAKGGDVMTKTHATGAAMTYGMRYLLKMIFNVAVGEDDTDGNATRMPEEYVLERVTWIEDAADVLTLQKVFTAVYKEAQTAGDKDAMYQYIQAKDKRKETLRANG